MILTVPPAGYENGTDFVGTVTGKVTAHEKAAAEMLAEVPGGEGEVGWIFQDADFCFTNQRDQAFKDGLAHLYPDVEVVAERMFSDPARDEDLADPVPALSDTIWYLRAGNPEIPEELGVGGRGGEYETPRGSRCRGKRP